MTAYSTVQFDPNGLFDQGASLQAWANSIAVIEGIPADLFTNLIGHESAWNPQAKGQAGEIGLAQVLPTTGQNVAPGANLNDPIVNMAVGAKYLRSLYDIYGNWAQAVQAYNGPLSNPKTAIYSQQVFAGEDAAGNALPYGQPLVSPSGLPGAIAGLINKGWNAIQGIDPTTGTVTLTQQNPTTGETAPIGTGTVALGPGFSLTPSGTPANAASVAGNVMFPAASGDASGTGTALAASPQASGDAGGSSFLGTKLPTAPQVAKYGTLILIIAGCIFVGLTVLGRKATAYGRNPQG